MYKTLIFLALLLITTPALASNDPLLGFWQTQDNDGVIEFYRCEDKFCGRFVWLEEDSVEKPSLDKNNPDEDKKTRPLCGMTLLNGFEKEGEGYDNGWIYSPRHGSRFSAQLRISETDQLTLRGYFLLPIFGGTQVWKRVEKPDHCWVLAMPRKLVR